MDICRINDRVVKEEKKKERILCSIYSIECFDQLSKNTPCFSHSFRVSPRKRKNRTSAANTIRSNS